MTAHVLKVARIQIQFSGLVSIFSIKSLDNIPIGMYLLILLELRPAMGAPESEVPPPASPPRTQARAVLTRTNLLDAALQVIRSKGYSATTIDDVCAAARVTKGSIFHHFSSKEALAIAATQHWNALTGGLFANAHYQKVQDPRERILAYIDFRADIVHGNLADVTCLLGTMVQETFDTYPAIRLACREGIDGHAQTLVPTIEAAKALYAPGSDWSAESLALYSQAALQGAFILAKAQGNSVIAAQSITHLRRYVQELFTPRNQRATGK